MNIGWEGEKSNGNTGREEHIIKGGIFVGWLVEVGRSKRTFEYCLEGLGGE